ncbi:MAG: orotate phosphoribosyltransferase [bacterium]|nr:orotate phosphoribosyltransferase [bacterium]
MSHEEGRARLLEMVLATFERKEITLSSGKKSNFYLDCRIPLMKPLGQKLAGEQMLGLLMSGPSVDAVGGMAVGAVPLVSAVLSAAAHHDPETDLRGFFVRKETKKHGKGRQIEGGFVPGQKVALVEDTCTTGGSTLDALELVEAAGGKVTRVLCLVDRGEGAAEVFAERGVELEAIFTRDDLPI